MTSQNQSFIAEAGINAMLLKMCGVILDVEKIPKNLSNALALISFLCLTLYSISYTYIFILYMNNLDTATAYLSLVMSFLGGQARFSILLWFRPKLMKMLEEYDILWSNLSISEKRKIHYFLNKSRLITIIYICFCAFTILSYAISFILQPQNLSENNITVTRRLPYAFVVKISETPLYEIMYAIQMFSVINVGFTCVGCDTTGMFLSMITCAHFTIIHERILRAWKVFYREKKTVENHLDTRNNENSFLEIEIFAAASSKSTDMVRHCIVYHQVLLKLCEEIEKVTNVLFLTGLIGTTYNLSLMGFKLVGNDPAKMTYAFQTAILIMQLFVYNWPPDLLITHSSEISKSAWFSPWYLFPTSARKLIIFTIKMAHRPVRLTAGKLFYLSLENFASMLSAAASFFTMLSTV